MSSSPYETAVVDLTQNFSKLYLREKWIGFNECHLSEESTISSVCATCTFLVTIDTAIEFVFVAHEIDFLPG